jgi:hypothetical protein
LSFVIAIHTELHANHLLFAQESLVSRALPYMDRWQDFLEVRITPFWMNKQLDPVVFYFLISSPALLGSMFSSALQHVLSLMASEFRPSAPLHDSDASG